MVVRFVLEHNEPLFFFPVVVYLADHRTGVDFLAHVHFLQISVFTEFLDGESGYIHKTGILVFPVPVNFFEGLFVKFPAFLYMRIVAKESHVLEFGQKGGMTAMVAPVSVHHLEFGMGGSSPFLAEITLHET